MTTKTSYLNSVRRVRLAADARMSKTNYTDDQIWELSLSGGDPDALSVSTSYGLRTRSVRIFPAFGLKGEIVTAPAEFFTKPALSAAFPSYARVDCSPFPRVGMRCEYWVPESNVLAGRTILANTGEEPLDLQFILFTMHAAGPDGHAFSQLRMEGVNVLAGAAGNLQPVLFLGGGAVPAEAVFPGLLVSTLLIPGESRSWTWAHAGLEKERESFQVARAAASENWDGRTARLEMLNTRYVHIETGEPAWDQAFFLSQRTALASMMSGNYELPYPSYVNGRLPGRGFSREGRGRDYDDNWSGQSLQETGLLISNLKYSAPEMAKGLLLNFLHRQRLDGFAPARPGLAGGTSRHRCPPLLAAEIWKLYQFTRDRDLLLSTRDGLVSLFNSWFLEEQDRDSDGFPEWDHVLHAEFERWRTFVPWHKWSQAMNLNMAETVDLLAFLLREAASLQFIFEELNEYERVEELFTHQQRLLELLDAVWEEEEGIFFHRDRDTHEILDSELLGEGEGEFTIELDRRFEYSVRVLGRIQGAENESRHASIHVHGRGKRGRGRVEKLGHRQISWFRELGSVTSEKTYRYIEKIEVFGVSSSFRTQILIPGTRYYDSGMLLPLWSRSLDQRRADRLVREHLLDPERFWLPGGIPQCAQGASGEDSDNGAGCCVVSPVRTRQIGQGLLNHGFREEAADLFKNLMGAVTNTLEEDQCFRSLYDARDLTGVGGRDSVQGLVPLDLFLSTLGVELISPCLFTVEGSNPFPWPVTIRWKGLTIRREGEVTDVTLPDGQQLRLEGEGKRRVELPRPENSR